MVRAPGRKGICTMIIARRLLLRAFAAAFIGFACLGWALAQSDPLPSWKAGAAKQAIIGFVAKVTDEGGADYVAPADRIASFDNDGTLWPSHPMYAQLAFAMDRIRELAPAHPEWKDRQPFKAVLEGDMDALAKGGEAGLMEIVAETHAGMSTAEFEEIVRNWFATAKHPKFARPYPELAYRPMVELLEYLRANGFMTYIVSGGGIEFMRPMTQGAYGIPPQQVIGSSIVTHYENRDGTPVLMREAKIDFIDDKAGKPVGINRFIGKRPIAAFGNSDGDREMLDWTAAGEGARLMMLVLHDDGAREYAYGPANGLPDTQFGRFSQELLDHAGQSGWTVISMKTDWAAIFAPEK